MAASASQVISFDKGYIPDPNEPIMQSIFQQYERVLIESLITSFGLDFIVKDQHGGDVDTIHNIRQIDVDPEMTYKNVLNQKVYDTKEEYNYADYHDKNPNYRATKKTAKEQFQKTGPLEDEYTGKKLYFYSRGAEKGNEDKQASIDHALTAYTIYKDRGRVLAGISGAELANSPENLFFTSKTLNSSMGATKESAVLVDTQKIKSSIKLDARQLQNLKDIANENGADGVVDILKILNSDKISGSAKKEIEDAYMPTIDLNAFLKKHPQKEYQDALKEICVEGKCKYSQILELKRKGKLKCKIDGKSIDIKKSIDADLVQPVEIPRYIALHPELDNRTKAGLMRRYKIALKSSEIEINKYYISPEFRKDLTYAAANVGLRMGVRQALGFVFTEMWFSVKDELQKLDRLDEKVSLSDYLNAIAHGLQYGYEQAKEKYPELFSRFLNGAVAGALSSLTTTLCNIFFTTAKSTVRIIRQSYASIVEAMKVLFINPDDYEFGDRMRAVVKILSVGASVTVGVLVSDAVAHTPLGAMGKTGDIVQSFCGAFVTGIMSCTLLMYLDRSKTINNLVHSLNGIRTVETEINYYRTWAMCFERYAAELMQIDLNQFERETDAFRYIAVQLDRALSEDELNRILKQAFKSRNLPLPWEGFSDFNSFMNDGDAHLVFQ